MFPLLPFSNRVTPADGEAMDVPWHSTPYQALPPVYVQNASLEIAWTRVVLEQGSLAGDVLVPFVTEGYEGFDINDPTDWMIAERLIADGTVPLPQLGFGIWDLGFGISHG
jgi:N-acylneuraminate cytidylyltransferase